MKYMLGCVHFHPFAALMIPIRRLHQFLLSGNPLPKKVLQWKAYILEQIKPKRTLGFQDSVWLYACISLSSLTMKNGCLLTTIYTSLKHYTAIFTQGHNHKFDIWQSQKNGNKSIWNRWCPCPCLSHKKSMFSRRN